MDPAAKGKRGRGAPKKVAAMPHSTVQPAVTPDADSPLSTPPPAAHTLVGSTNATSLPGATSSAAAMATATITTATTTTAAPQQLLKVRDWWLGHHVP